LLTNPLPSFYSYDARKEHLTLCPSFPSSSSTQHRSVAHPTPSYVTSSSRHSPSQTRGSPRNPRDPILPSPTITYASPQPIQFNRSSFLTHQPLIARQENVAGALQECPLRDESPQVFSEIISRDHSQPFQSHEADRAMSYFPEIQLTDPGYAAAARPSYDFWVANNGPTFGAQFVHPTQTVTSESRTPCTFGPVPASSAEGPGPTPDVTFPWLGCMTPPCDQELYY
jgi:hypothetical protein